MPHRISVSSLRGAWVVGCVCAVAILHVPVEAWVPTTPTTTTTAGSMSRSGGTHPLLAVATVPSTTTTTNWSSRKNAIGTSRSSSSFVSMASSSSNDGGDDTDDGKEKKEEEDEQEGTRTATLNKKDDASDTKDDDTSDDTSDTDTDDTDTEDEEEEDEEWEYVDYEALTETDFVNSEWLVGTVMDNDSKKIKETWCRMVTDDKGTNLAIWGDKAEGKWNFDTASQFLSVSKETFGGWGGKKIWAGRVDDYYFQQGSVRGWSFLSPAEVLGQWQARRLNVEQSEAGEAPWFQKKNTSEQPPSSAIPAAAEDEEDGGIFGDSNILEGSIFGKKKKKE